MGRSFFATWCRFYPSPPPPQPPTVEKFLGETADNHKRLVIAKKRSNVRPQSEIRNPPIRASKTRKSVPVFGIHRQALLGAGLDAVAADDAAVGIERPAFGIARDAQGVGGAAFLAEAAEDAGVDVDLQALAAPVGAFRRTIGYGRVAGFRVRLAKMFPNNANIVLPMSAQMARKAQRCESPRAPRTPRAPEKTISFLCGLRGLCDLRGS